MRKIVLVIVGILFVASSFAQMNDLSGENFDQIKELRKSKLYVYIERVKNEGSYISTGKDAKQDRINTSKYYKEVIESLWDYCDYEFINKEKYKILKKDDNLFFLTNTVKDSKSNGGAQPGSTIGKTGGSVSITRYLMLSKGEPSAKKFRKREHIFMIQFSSVHTKSMSMAGQYSRVVITDKDGGLEAPSKGKIKTELKLINTYLNDCIAYNTPEIKIIAKKNAKNLKGKTLGLQKLFLKFKEEDVKGIKALDFVFVGSISPLKLLKKGAVQDVLSEFEGK